MLRLCAKLPKASTMWGPATFSNVTVLPAASLSTRKARESVVFRDPIRQVFFSQSSDMPSNLALEDWLYRNHDYDHKHLLLIWRNDPCMVIGRRSRCCGGTVFHDMGNINCTFFTRKSHFLHRKNVDIVSSAIRRLTHLDVEVNDDQDIVLNHSTSQSDGSGCQHHTLLVNMNQCVLYEAPLFSKENGQESRATQTIRIPVRLLRHLNPALSVESIQEALGWEFLRTTIDGIDCGMEVANHQRGFQMIRPDNDWFPGLDRLREDFQQSQLLLARKSPRFKVCQKFPLSESLKEGIAFNSLPELKVELDVHERIIQDVRIYMPYGLLHPDLDLSTVMHGLKFGQDLPEAVFEVMTKSEISQEKKEFVCQCIQDMVSRFV